MRIRASRTRGRHGPRHRGQSSVELLAVLPALAVLVVVTWLGLAAALAWIDAAGAARAGARAAEVGAPASSAAEAAVRSGRVRAEVDGDGVIRARVRARLVPGLGPVEIAVARGPR